MRKSVPINGPCPCGSGKEYKHCCLTGDRKVKRAQSKVAAFSFDDGSQMKRTVHSLDSIPTHNRNGLAPDITKKQMIDLVLDDFLLILNVEQIGMLADMTNRVGAEMNIVPVFTYRDLGNALDADSRFEHYCMQVICLAGNDPTELLVDKMGT